MKNRILFSILFFIISLYSQSQDCITVDQSELASKINDFRASNGKQKLTLSKELCSTSRRKAKSLHENGSEVSLASDFFKENEQVMLLKVRNDNVASKNLLPTLTLKDEVLYYWKVILETEEYEGKEWKSFGIGYFQNSAALWFSDLELNDEAQICNKDSSNITNTTEINKYLPTIKNGAWLVEPTYYKLGFGYSENDLYPVANDSEKWGYINTNGEVMIPFQYERAYGFSEGLAAVLLNGKYGYINPKNEFEISPSFSSAGFFNNGTALINQNNLDYYINNKGVKISEGNADMQMLNNSYFTYMKGGLYGIKNLSGEVVKQPFMSDFFSYSEGLAAVKIKGKWGFMNEKFELVITPIYTEKLTYSFHDGYARFKQNGKIGLMDKQGNIMLEAVYDDLYEYSDGLMAYSKNGKWGYINLLGEVIIPPQYFSAENFQNGIAKVKDGPSNCHLIDTNNEILIQNVYDINIFSNGIIGVNAKHGWGLVKIDIK